MLRFALITSVISTVALLLGFTEFAAAAAMAWAVLISLVAITFVVAAVAVICATRAGRVVYWFPPPG